MSITLLQAAARPATPWRNGGGITREITAAPAGALLTDFNWRISMAEITEPGPFSTFPGIDRILTVITGTLTLAFAGQPDITLHPSTNPLAFPGEAPCLGTPQNGPVTDLNIMLRRESHAAAQRRIANETVRINAKTSVLVALSKSTALLAAQKFQLNQFDALLIEDHDTEEFGMQGVGYLIEIKAR